MKQGGKSQVAHDKISGLPKDWILAVENKVRYHQTHLREQLTRLNLLADFLTGANYGLYIGNFEMDFNDGEVRFKTSIDVEGNKSVAEEGKEPAELSFALMKRMVYDNVGVMDKYLPGVMSVIYGGASPTEAIAKVEGKVEG